MNATMRPYHKRIIKDGSGGKITVTANVFIEEFTDLTHDGLIIVCEACHKTLCLRTKVIEADM